MREKPYLGELEKLLLLAILGLGNDADGTSVRKRLHERANRDVSVGALYATLDRMEEKKFVEARIGHATARTGNRQMKYYRVEALGEKALRESEQTRERMIQGVNLPLVTSERAV